ncbi:hypothetical protein [uncultured Kordia sp.]|uniref:hypothetical protein n=1 Tax=uncultured Kordia sp. TaxID=507699 RepID=UPI00262A6C30|nr:hypothetical protein [uncultured Kordia sp.]
MKGPFNIHKKNQKIYLTTGIYNIKVLGGWSVEMNDFSLVFKKEDNGMIVESKKTMWRVQSYDFKKIAKRIMVLDILYSGDYIIEFKNSESLKVRRSNLILTKLFENEIPNEALEITIG